MLVTDNQGNDFKKAVSFYIERNGVEGRRTLLCLRKFRQCARMFTYNR